MGRHIYVKPFGPPGSQLTTAKVSISVGGWTADMTVAVLYDMTYCHGMSFWVRTLCDFKGSLYKNFRRRRLL